jgi:hypothetical protein
VTEELEEFVAVLEYSLPEFFRGAQKQMFEGECRTRYPPITYYWTVPLILDHSCLVGNWTISKIAETKALEPLKSGHFCISNFRTC